MGAQHCSKLKCMRFYSIAVVLGKCLCAHHEPSPNGSQLISLALNTNVVCIGSLVKECVWESPGSRNGLCVNLCCSSAQGKWHSKLCSELVSQSHCWNLRGKGEDNPHSPQSRGVCWLLEWWGSLLALDELGISNIAVSLGSEGSCLAAFCCGISPCLSSEQVDASIGNSAMAYGNVGAGKSKGCCGEAHVCNAEEHWLAGSPCCFALLVLLYWTRL